MKITRRQLKQIIKEQIEHSPWIQDAPDVVRQVYTGGSPDQWQALFGDNRTEESEEISVHPSRQMGTGRLDSQGVEYWENWIIKKINMTGPMPITGILYMITDIDDEDKTVHDSYLHDLSFVIKSSDKLEYDENKNIEVVLV